VLATILATAAIRSPTCRGRFARLIYVNIRSGHEAARFLHHDNRYFVVCHLVDACRGRRLRAAVRSLRLRRGGKSATILMMVTIRLPACREGHRSVNPPALAIALSCHCRMGFWRQSENILIN